MKILDITDTPNPNAMKFILDAPLTQLGITRMFYTPEEAEGIPLAQEILDIEHVESLYFADRWLTVTQDGAAEWSALLREIAGPIRAAEAPNLTAADSPKLAEIEGVGMDDPRIPDIQQVLDEYILPYLQMDGGGLVIRGLADDQLYIQYEGACGTCPSSASGTIMAIEALVQREIDPELEVVIV